MTADQLFKDMHQEQLKSAQEWVKNTSHSCSTVVVLVATVVFAAAIWTSHPPGKTSVLVFHGDGRSGAGELLDVGGDLPLHPHFIGGVPRFSQHRASGSLAGLHIPLLLCDVDDADIHGHDSPAGSSAEKMDCNINVCGYVPSNRVFHCFSSSVLPVLH
ncbi:hypothetical protein PVK06_044681 [Gossypium arboreum]|uniref:Transmembrane protein n=1 Tax=Gossypium arboreum TaxID=29729 RepID=A0ABR0MUD9_GOSAR|nr:hypothetical protein PVK06_044681 [Gossypium arboreum]